MAQIQERAIQIDKISPAQLQKYRQVGVKGGSKTFQLKSPRGNPQAKSKDGNSDQLVKPGKSQTKNEGDASKNLSFEKLQAKVSEKDLPKEPQTKTSRISEELNKEQDKSSPIYLKKEVKAIESGIPLTSLRSSNAVGNFKRQSYLKRDMMKEMGPQVGQSDIITRTGLNLHFEPPDGVSEDELNSVEKKFYSFQKRTFVSYVQSLLSVYQQKLINRPQIENIVKNETHLVTGKIDFDREGNILRIKILRSSPSDEVHNLFEETLKAINRLPNPPDLLIKDREQFTIYYQLRIN